MNLLIDGSSLLWRSHYANKAQDRASVPSNIHLFIKSMKSYVKMYNAENVYIAWDKRLLKEKNFRHTSTEGEYKGNRNKEMAVEVYEAQSKIHKVTQTLGCKNLYPWVMEADDIIAWLSTNIEGHNVIVTSDQDMLQLINNRTCVFQPRKKRIIDHDNFEEMIGMPIKYFLPYKAILGDKSDNIPGIKGCGPVGSKKLAKLWVDNREDVEKDHVSIIENNIRIMDLSIGYTIGSPKEIEAYKLQIERYADLKPDMEEFEKLCKEYEFNSILNDIDQWKSIFKKSYLLEIFNDMTF